MRRKKEKRRRIEYCVSKLGRGERERGIFDWMTGEIIYALIDRKLMYLL